MKVTWDGRIADAGRAAISHRFKGRIALIDRAKSTAMVVLDEDNRQAIALQVIATGFNGHYMPEHAAEVHLSKVSFCA